MKNILLPILLLILALTQMSAQKSLPHSLQPYTANVSWNIHKSMKEAGFDLKTTGPQFNDPLQLDSTISFYGYELTENGDSTPFKRAIHLYPSEDIKIEIDASYENGQWVTLSRTTFTKDEKQRIVEAFAEAFNPETQTYQPDSYLKVFPHGDSETLFDSMSVSQWDSLTQDWIVLFAVSNTFDGDRLMESLSTFDYFGETILLRDVHSYDANGDNTGIETFAVFSGFEFPSGSQTFAYENHLLTEHIEYVSDDNGFSQPNSKITYSYNSFDKVEQQDIFIWRGDLIEWGQLQGINHAYDNTQRLIATEAVSYNEGEPDGREMTTYAYIQNENLALESFFVWDGANFLLSDRTYYYYNQQATAAPEPAKALALRISPNPATDVASFNLTEVATVQIYNTQGKMLRSSELQPNTTVQLGDLPSGVYFVTATSAGALYSGRLVKE